MIAQIHIIVARLARAIQNRKGSPTNSVCVVVAILICLLSAPAAATQCESPLTNGLVGHWRLDETSGALYDSSGNGNAGTSSGGVTYASAGVLGNSMNFDGVDGAISIPDNAVLDVTEDMTLSFWLYLTGIPASDSNVMGKSPCWGTACPYEIYVGGDGTMNMTQNDGSAGQDSVGTAASFVNPNSWTHVALVRKISSTSWDVYVDGTLFEGGINYTRTPTANSGALIIGNNGTPGDAPFGGDIDDVRIYNRALSDTEINMLAQKQDVAPGDIRFNSDIDAVEYCDGDDWVMAGTGSYASPAVNFDGTTAHLRSGTNLYLDIGNNKQLSGSGWFRRTTSGVSETIYTTTGSAIRVRMTSTDYFEVRGENTLGTVILLISSLATITDTDWHHFMFSVDMSDTNKRYLYIDGADALGVTTYTDGNIDFDIGNVAIGGNTGGTVLFTGDIADLWMDYGTYIDFSSATQRAKFLSPTGMPMYLGADGSLPTGSPPEVFMSGDVDNWHINKGMGGGFTEYGTLTAAGTNPTATSGATALPSGCPSIGDRCDDNTVYAGLSPDGNVAMFTTPDDAGSLEWNNGNNGNWTTTGATSTLTGAANTATIVATDADSVTAGMQTHNAAQYCYDLVAHGASDWYLPAQDELNVLYTNRVTIGSFELTAGEYGPPVSSWYWSSTEFNSDGARLQRFEDGTVPNSWNKHYDKSVRCVRKGAAPRCTGPSGVEGSIIYNTDQKVMQYCNGADWVAMGPVGGTGGGGCTSPAGSAGDIMFNDDHNVLQFCNSEDWVGIGKQIVPTDSLVGYWTLDEASGTFADSSGNGNDGTQFNGVSYRSGSAKLGYAAGFDGVDDRIQVPDSASLSFGDGTTSSPLTVCAWVNARDMQASGFVSKCQATTTGSCEFSLGGGSTGTIRMNIYDNDVGCRIGLESASTYTSDEGAWHHYCGTYDGGTSNTGITIYRDGDRLATTGNDSSGPCSGASYEAIHDTSDTVDIGHFLRTSGAFKEPLDGFIDDVRIYDKELSAQEIKQLYYSTK